MKSPRQAIALIACLAASSASAEPAPADPPEAVLARVIDLAQQHALGADQVDWPSAEKAASEILKQDGSEAGLSASIRYVLAKLRDGHSSYRPVQPRTEPATAPVRAPIAVSSASPEGTPILALNAWAGRDVAGAATAVRRELVAALGQASCGMILDLSQNSGGNMWPMVMGVLPLFPEGMLGGFEGRDAARTSIVSTGSGLLVGGSGHFLNALALPQPVGRPAHIAVIIGDRTASSGEITAVLFKGQENVRYFGRKSAGVPTANRTFPLPNGAMLALTTSATLDRDGHRYTTALVPDVESATPIEAADRWLKGACAAQAGVGTEPKPNALREPA